MRYLLTLVGCLTAVALAPALAGAAAPPDLTSTLPASPANDNAPVVNGTADASSTVVLYTASDCTGDVLATGAADGLGAFAIPSAVLDNSTTTIWATADGGVVSACSTSSVTYVEDSAPPNGPLLFATSPSSPSTVNSVAVRGFAEPGSTVGIYITPDCSGPPAAVGAARAFNGLGIPVVVADNTTNVFRATATDPVGNISQCSLGSLVYREDSLAPDTTILTGPDALTGSSDATFTFSASEPGAAFECDIDASPDVFAWVIDPSIHRDDLRMLTRPSRRPYPSASHDELRPTCRT